MDLICANCGESWELDYVLYEDPGAFKRDGSMIIHCPSCEWHKKNETRNEKRTAIARAIADVMGDDIDGAVVEMEDMEGYY